MDSSRSWLVAAGCCWVNIFCVVMIRSGAIVYVGIIETFQVTREEATWPGTASATCYFTAALVAGVLARHVAVWKITFTACIVAATSVSLCFFANSVTYLALLYGVVHGWSVGHVTLSSTVINQHFVKYRAVASGLNLAGFSVGGLIFPPTIQYFIDQYGFRGAFLLAGGTILNATVGTLLQRIPAPEQPGQAKDKPAKPFEVSDSSVSGSGTISSAPVVPEVNCKPAFDLDKAVQAESVRSVTVADGDDKEGMIGVYGAPRGRHSWKCGEENDGFEPCETTSRQVSKENIHEIPCTGRSSSLNEQISSSAREAESARKRTTSAMATLGAPTQGVHLAEYGACNEIRDRATHLEPTVQNAEQNYGAEHSHSELSATRVEMADTKETRKLPGGVKAKLLAAKELLSFLALPKFYAVVLSKIVMITNSSIFSTVIIDFALDHGIDRWKALTLISAFTAMDLTARLTSGWITDRKIFSRSTFMALCLAVWTAVDICFAFFHSYAVLVILSGVAGWCNGSLQPLVPVLYMEVVDIGRFSLAYGLSSFLVGLTAFARPSLAGYFRDTLGNYSGLFLAIAAFTALCTMRWIYAAVQERCCRDGRKK
ncbi:uncharacterized protein LOC142579260 [Dermacentor variabilis]|uniref:uncharacterized protein LOC142579260 n=1 Tax=Dermacentor variabilis TaxID=34621 RepID=UPI003F5C1525